MRHQSRRRITHGLLLLTCALSLDCDDPVGSERSAPSATPQTTAPAPLASDGFNRANENPLAGNWTPVPGPAGAVQLRSNAVTGTGEFNGAAVYNALSFPADQWAEATVAALGVGDDGSVLVRGAADGFTAYRAAVFSDGSLAIRKSIRNTGTLLRSLGGAGTVVAGDRIRIEVHGTLIQVYKNGVFMGETTDGDIAAGAPGVHVAGTSLVLDDWAGGGVVSSPPSAPPAAPTTLAAAAVTASQINLSWTDNATNEDGFRIERCVGAGCSGFAEIATVGANVVSYQNTGLTASTSYGYRVRAYNGAGPSAYSNTATATTPAAPAADRFADLGMARLSDLRIDQSGGRRRLRFSTTIVNVGAGKFELHGRRANTGEPTMSVVQRIFNDAGGSRDVATPAVMVFGGDGHSHWHVRDLQQSELFRLDDGMFLARSEKRGFCFWDNVKYRTSLPGAPQSAVYQESGCGGTASLTTAMGLSIGWGDIYPSSLPDQFIDITGLPDGTYRLLVTTDPSGWFAETDESNNFTSVDLELSNGGTTLRILGYGPNAVFASFGTGP